MNADAHTQARAPVSTPSAAIKAARRFKRFIDRAEGCASRGSPLELETCALADQAILRGLTKAVRARVSGDRKARSFRYRGRLFRLAQLDGWVVVMTWRGYPIAGPLRVEG
jgi:hypothetical protein